MTAQWMDSALCAQVGPDLFFSGDTKGGSTARSARRICDACPVTRECLAFALANEAPDMGKTFGTYGGVPARARSRMRRT